MEINDFSNKLFIGDREVASPKEHYGDLLDYSFNEYIQIFWSEIGTKIIQNEILNLNSLDEYFRFLDENENNSISLKFYCPNFIDELFPLLNQIKLNEEDKVQTLFAKTKYIFKFAVIKKLFSFESQSERERWQQYIFSNLMKNKLSKSNLEIYLLRLEGKTLQEIADKNLVTREAVRQKIKKIINMFKIDEEFFEGVLKDINGLINNHVKDLFLKKFNRLPCKSDEVGNIYKTSTFFNDCTAASLTTRISIYKELNINISKEEYDYHYKFFEESEVNATPGHHYWDDFNNLKEYILRYARIEMGKPDVMPKQTSFKKRGIGGAVTKHGGQSKVASLLGLKYQGQLVSEDKGRKYWTDKKLYKLLDDINDFHKQSLDIQPSWGQFCEFFKNTDIPEYKDKKPQAPVAAMTNQGNLSWAEAAIKFGKKNISGTSQRVNPNYIKAFVRDLGEHLAVLSDAELFVLLQAEGITSKGAKFSRTYDVLIDAFQNGEVGKKDLEDWSNNIDVPVINELLDLGSEINSKVCSREERELILLNRRSKTIQKNVKKKIIDLNKLDKNDLPSLNPIRSLKALDKAAGILNDRGSDIALINFLKAKATSRLWDSCFANENDLLENLNSNYFDKDSYSSEVKAAFLEEYNGAKNLEIPESYKFRDLGGYSRQPKLMQRLVAFRLLRDKRLLNLSGTGTGKTLSAILAAQICQSKRIFISCPNGVVDSWVRTFESAYPAAILHIKPKNWNIDLEQNHVNVVIANHEKFQDRFSEEMLRFTSEFLADLIVIDEIHQSKSRNPEISSQRRNLINQFIKITSNLIPDLRVLGLSATPVINNIYEGASLVELITQQKLEGARSNDINACMILYQKFIVHGIRMNPGNLSRTKIHMKNIDTTYLLPEVVEITNSSRVGNFHEIERLLVEPKLNCLEEFIDIKQKTIIFITNIKGTLIPIRNWLNTRLIKFSVYTGEDKEAAEEGFKDSLDEFIKGETKVLVASIQCAGTGIDGLQSVCNNAIFFQLPWTSTEFEQSIGRLDRDGTNFESINVYLPMTNINLSNGEKWSWCQSKLDRIESKKDIAKAAVDGEMPNSGSIISPKEATKLWLNWLKRLENS